MPIPASADATASAAAARAVTPSDAPAYYGARALYIGGAGNVTLINLDGSPVLFANVPAGGILPVYNQGVMATGTTATNIVALL